MLYRDFMQKFRPLYAPDGVSGGASDGAAAAASAGTTADTAAPTAGAQDAAPAAAVPTGSDGAPAADAAPAPDSAPTLLEAADGKKPEAKPEGDGKKAEPAPAEAAKTDADKTAGDKDGKKPAEKTEAELKAEADAAKATDPDNKDATADAPPAPISYEPFKLPDGLKLDDKELTKFTEIAGKAQIPQDVAQSMIDLYIAERQNDVALARAEQRKTWDTLNDTWKTELRNDPELGGNRLETSLSLAKAVVEEYLPAGDVAEYMAHMRNNGMGNFKLHVKLLHNIGKALNVFEDGIVPANPQAPKAQKGPGQRGWYDKSLNAPS